MEEKTLFLSQYLQLVMDFEQDPNGATEAAIDGFLGELIIKEYLPIKQKSIAVITVLSMLNSEFDVSGSAVYLEINKVMKGLLSYCTNLVDDLSAIGNTMGVYDKLYIYGLIPAIKEVCKEDYGVLCDMIDNALNITNIEKMISTASLLNNTEYDKWIDVMNDLREELTPETLKNLLTISHVESDEFKELSGDIISASIDDANNKIAAYKIKGEKIKHDSERGYSETLSGEVDDGSNRS